MGKIDVYVDGILRATVDCSAAEGDSQYAAYTVLGLPEGKHTLKLVKASGDYMIVDAFEVWGTLVEEVTLESFVPQYLNQAITFTGDDMGSDRAMITMLLYMIIVIIAFVFGITISNTIRKEAGVIGTLRASGYTRKELIGHYMALPVIVTLIGAVVGNILGYTALKNVCAGMYYGAIVCRPM